ncbi:MAG: PBSX family phage terminase large subunit [Lachnospiraceae bacterium]|nr:PBSX family phage terminase large subunit [Lachnospiraceae bacterium]
MIINFKKLNPLGFHLLKLFQDPTIRQIILMGGSSSGKSYSVAEVFLLMAFYEGEDQLVMRKVGASIKDSIYTSFKAAAEHLGISDLFQFKDGIKVIKCKYNGAEIKFKGLDDSEKIKGLESIKRVFMDEWNEYEEKDYKQMKLRLRGMKGQQLVFAFNPIKETHWIKKNVFDKEEWHDVSMEVELGGVEIPSQLTEVKSYRMNAPKTMMHKRTGEIIEHPSDIAMLQTTYLNNFWVVGSPDGTYGYYDDQAIATFEHDRIHDPDYYNVYALGEWGVIRTGSEYFHAFNRGHHCKVVEYDPSLPIHISVDDNRLPYISYTFWQVDYSNGIQLRQFHEICATSPDNSAKKSAVLVAKYLRSIGYQDKIYLHGDCTTRNGNTIDDEGRSFLDKVISTLTDEGFEVVDKVSKSNPSVPMSGEFINAIYEYEFPDIRIFIDENCVTSIEDYLSVQKDANGGINKTKVKNKITMQTYEEHGHLSDTKRYIVCDILNVQFVEYSNKRKRNLYAKDNLIQFYNPTAENTYNAELVYCMPNVANKFVMVHGKKCGEHWHIVDVAFFETSSTEDIKQRLNAISCSPTYLEAGKPYYPFVRELRSEVEYTVKVMPEDGDIDRRIAATSDFVKSNIKFNESKASESEEYSAFMTSLLDYNKDSQNKEASAVLSGFIKVAIKFFSNG